jgi:O-antigen/teichoic acid export membrane protein
LGIIQRQGLTNAVITFIGLVIGFVSLLYIQPKFLTPEEIGLTRVLFSVSALVGMFLPLGIGTITLRYFPKFRNEENGHNGFLGFIALYMLTGIALMGIVLYATKGFIVSQYQQQSPLFTQYYSCVLPFSFIIGFNGILGLYCNSLFKSVLPAVLNDVVLRIGSIILFTIYFCKLISLSTFVYLFVGTYFIQGLCLVFYITSIHQVNLRPNFALIKEIGFRSMAVYGIWMSFVSVASIGIKYIDSIVIAKYYVLDLVGIYTIAAFIPNVIEAPLLALERIAGAKIAHAIAHNHIEEVKKIYYKSSRYLLVLGGLIFIGIVVNIQFVLQLLPPAYMGGLEVVYIMSLGAIFSILGGNNTQIIFSSENFWKGGILLIGVAITALLLNLLLIPRFGINGAAMAMAASSLIYTVSKFLIIYKQFRLQPYTMHTLIIVLLIAACIGLAMLFPVFNHPLVNIVTHSVAVTFIYCISILGLKLVPEANNLIQRFNPFGR